jgi:ParB family chromosome partitioning protein
MGKRFNLTEFAAEKPFVPPAYNAKGASPNGSTAGPATAVTDEEGFSGAQGLPVSSIALNPLNERPDEDDEDIAGLAATLRDYGVIQPILACSSVAFIARYPATATEIGAASWVVLIGNRRLRAARRAQIETVPAIVNDDQLATMYRAMLIENLQSRAMPPLHEAEAMSKAMQEEGLTQTALAAQIGKTQGFVSQRLALLKLVPELRSAMAAGDLVVEVARQIADLPPAQQHAIATRGKPYRVDQGSEPKSSAARRGWAASPVRAAAAIEKAFTNADELTELIDLLNAQLAALQAASH